MKEVHLICNAHIDTIWQWDWQEGVSAVLSTFQTAVNLSEKYEYIFCHNEVTVYEKAFIMDHTGCFGGGCSGGYLAGTVERAAPAGTGAAATAACMG